MVDNENCVRHVPIHLVKRPPITESSGNQSQKDRPLQTLETRHWVESDTCCLARQARGVILAANERPRSKGQHEQVLIFGGLWTLFHGDGQLSRVKTQSAPLLQSVSIQNPANEAQCPLSVRTNDDKVGKQQFPSLCSRQWSREAGKGGYRISHWGEIMKKTFTAGVKPKLGQGGRVGIQFLDQVGNI
ncbi:hypothetical protein RRG08_052006 [Elysia crispata]|uniref:Uncharacterized protein n=1 Tax=Elysia crispata TaxID=231223 RepID=A0AAE0ZCP2_9GAST|nr:hypothetical protein RRG08_052006 [Elysia crispata]